MRVQRSTGAHGRQGRGVASSGCWKRAVLRCPACGIGWPGGVMPGSGRFSGRAGPGRAVRPRRSRCTGCGVTHVLLPAGLLLRRMDEARVIGRGAGLGGPGPGSPPDRGGAEGPGDTVRGWLRRAACRAGQVREVFTKVAAAVSADPVPLEPAGSPAGRCAGGGRGGGGRGRGPVAAAARGVAVGGRLGGHQCDAAGAGDGRCGVQREFPLVSGPSLAVTLDGPAAAGTPRRTGSDNSCRKRTSGSGWSGPGRSRCSGIRWSRK